jgi:hypothetical protein
MDVFLDPKVGTFNILTFLSFIQADGYNPLTVASTNFIVEKPQIESLLDEIGIVDPINIGMREVVKGLLMAPWRPGSLFKGMYVLCMWVSMLYICVAYRIGICIYISVYLTLPTVTFTLRTSPSISDFVSVGASFRVENAKLLQLVTHAASQHFAAQFMQNGFWADHWTYILDLVDNYVSVFPDLEHKMLWKESVCLHVDSVCDGLVCVNVT